MRQPFDKTQLERLSKTRFSRVEWVKRIASTNADLRERAEQGAPEGIVRIADYQTHGRGRQGRKWESPPEASLLVSLLLRPKCQPSEFGWLTYMAGLAVADLCEETTGAQARLKWPNDVVADDMKLAGVLAEAVSEAVVLGIGLNVSWPEAKSQQPGFNQVPVSLKALAERVADGACHEGASRESTESQESRESNAPVLPERAELLVRLLGNFEQRYSSVGQPDWSSKLRDEAKQRSATLGRRVAVTMPSSERASQKESPKEIREQNVGEAWDEEIRGVAVDITASGSLLVAVSPDSPSVLDSPSAPDSTDTPSAPESQRRVEITAGDVVHLRSEAN